MRLRTLADRLIRLSAFIGAAGLLIEMGIILVDVIGRMFGSPLYGSQDLSTMAMVIVVFGGMAICDRNGGHIAIDLFESRFPPGFNHLMDVVSALLGASIFAMIAWTVYESAKLSLMLNLSTNLLNLPKAWFQWALCGFALITSFGMALRAIELAFNHRNIHQEAKL